jgi:uncharacterized membrane protein YraQ (UPF0718 family)
MGGIVAGVVWNAWSFLLNNLVGSRYVQAQNAGLFLKQPRYPGFVVQWIVILFILGIIMAHLYAWSRSTLRPGPVSAIKLGLVAGFPLSFAQATWSPVSRYLPLAWMLEMWVGTILATLVAGALYKE